MRGAERREAGTRLWNGLGTEETRSQGRGKAGARRWGDPAPGWKRGSGREDPSDKVSRGHVHIFTYIELEFPPAQRDPLLFGTQMLPLAPAGRVPLHRELFLHWYFQLLGLNSVSPMRQQLRSLLRSLAGRAQTLTWRLRAKLSSSVSPSWPFTVRGRGKRLRKPP